MPFDSLLNLADRVDVPAGIRQFRRDGLQALLRGLNSVLPEVLLPEKIHLARDVLKIDGLAIARKSFSQLIIVGGGKATAGMCRSVISLLGDRVPLRGAINVPYPPDGAHRIGGLDSGGRVEVTFCNHPIPDAAGIHGVEKMRALIAASPRDAIVLALISGGGSALMPLPAEGITLEDKQAVNRILLSCGAAIDEINCIRKHLSRFKGGQLSTFAHPRRVMSLILSDVIGNDLQTIASGPTVPDVTTFGDMAEIVRKYGISAGLPPGVRQRLSDGLAGRIQETPKADTNLFNRTTNLIIGSAERSAAAARSALIEAGYHCECFSHRLSGEARRYGAQLARRLPEFRAAKHPAAFIGTGELTVTIAGDGKGGRNQELLSGFLAELQDNPRLEANRLSWVIIAAAFDGLEGNSGAMGAIIDSGSLQRLQGRGIDIRPHLERNDSRAVFEALGDLLITGQTGTNVNDMLIILIDG